MVVGMLCNCETGLNWGQCTYKSGSESPTYHEEVGFIARVLTQDPVEINVYRLLCEKLEKEILLINEFLIIAYPKCISSSWQLS